VLFFVQAGDQNKAEIVRLGVAYSITSKHTAFVAVEERSEAERLQQQQQQQETGPSPTRTVPSTEEHAADGERERRYVKRRDSDEHYGGAAGGAAHAHAAKGHHKRGPSMASVSGAAYAHYSSMAAPAKMADTAGMDGAPSFDDPCCCRCLVINPTLSCRRRGSFRLQRAPL
jgi:hypothetical protein